MGYTKIRAKTSQTIMAKPPKTNQILVKSPKTS